LANILATTDPVRDRLGPAIQIFCVGGAVRDAILGISSVDHDFVVVGATVDDMLAAGFTPVGQDFPVFLHPVSHDEYALARTERKSGKGYKEFVFNAAASVTLAEDLSRRDLTINAIAINQHGDLTDPFGGIHDLDTGVLRHIGPAFSEDPVRLLRIARFASRWPSFSVAPETMALCKDMVSAGETRELVAERVWQELQKGLMGQQPSRMLAILAESGAWFDLHAEIQAPTPAAMAALDQAAQDLCPLEVRYALMVLNHGAPQPADVLKAPRHCIDLAAVAIQQTSSIDTVIAALAKTDARAIDVLFDWLMQADHRRINYRIIPMLVLKIC
jgi:tRNA nucleotidyltransferase (CCA-adding enzyme)